MFNKRHNIIGGDENNMCELVSIIIPTYNVQEYVFRAIESSLTQTYKNIEVVIVDDGSSDNTIEVIKKYQSCDKRIVAAFQENSGVSSARNRGLSLARGEYAIFLDSDDWLEDDAVDYMMSLKNKYHDCLACCDRFFVYDDNNKLIRKRQRPIDELKHVSKNEAFLNIGTGAYNLQSSCYKLFDMSIIRNASLLFDEQIFHGEDGLFVAEYLNHVSGVVFSSKPLWDIFERQGSATMSGYNPKWLTMILGINRIIDIAPKNDAVQEALYIYKIKRLSILIRELFSSNVQMEQDWKMIINEIESLLQSHLYSKLHYKYKVALLVINSVSPVFMRTMYNFYRRIKNRAR